MRLGVITDGHGKDVNPALEQFDLEKVDAILVNGDMQSYNYGEHDFRTSLRYFANNTNATVLIIPGNHEVRSTYYKVLKEMEDHKHIIDLHSRKEYVLEGIAFVGYGGSSLIPAVIPEHESFRTGSLDDVFNLSDRLRKHSGKKTVLQMHEPPFGYGDIAHFYESQDGSSRIPAEYAIRQYGRDIEPHCKKEHVGNESLKELIEGGYGNPKPTLATCGDIHESHKFLSPGQEIGTKREVREEENVSHLALNPGAYKDGRIAIVQLGDGVSYRIKQMEVY